MSPMKVCRKHGLYQPGPPSIPGGRCPNCYRGHNRGRQHRKVRAQVLAEETVCWICGNPPTEYDPLTLDHVVPLLKAERRQGRTAEQHTAAATRGAARR
jgi:hypothetical protein